MQCPLRRQHVACDMETPTHMNCSFVLTGSMNPALHHPLWYRDRGLISEAEEKQALEKGSPMLLPSPQPYASFSAGFFQVKCDAERWEITTSRPDQFDTIRGIAQKLFDEVLPHTPVR